MLHLCRNPINRCCGHHCCDLCTDEWTFQDFGRGPVQFPRARQYTLRDGRRISTNQLIIQTGGIDVRLGNGEIRVAGPDDLTYRAPTLIYHCVTVHDYHPPDEFIAAVMAS